MNPHRIAYDEIIKKEGYSKFELFATAIGIEIQKVIFNDPVTIVYWSDGTKTVVRATNEKFDQEKGLAMAISKKAFGNKGNYFNNIKKWVNDQQENKENE
jgi:hypothetical protein